MLVPKLRFGNESGMGMKGIPEKPKRIIINPGGYYVSDERVIITTTLGSCVSACLYDPVRHVVGMNHFLITGAGYDEEVPVCETEPGKYGVCAMELLIGNMLNLGADRKHLHAKLFGGSSMFKPFDECRMDTICVGNANVLFIREFMNVCGIQVVSEDLGGNTGRVIRFHSGDFAVYVRKIKKIVNFKIIRKEKGLWDRIKASGQPVLV